VCDIVVKKFTLAISSPDAFLLFLGFSLIFVSVPRAKLSWPFRQLLSARKLIYRIVSYSKPP